MFIGLDIGSSLTKIVRVSAETGPLFDREPYGIVGGCSMSDADMLRLAEYLTSDGASVVGLTGTGAARFKKVAAATGSLALVLRPGVDPIVNELELQADGVRGLLHGSADVEASLMVVSVGSGTSFTLVRGGDVRPFTPGLAVGGRYIERLSGLVGVTLRDIESAAERGADSDLLVKHVNPAAKFPVGDFVVAAMGRLGDPDVPVTPENVVAGAVKHVASAVAGHLLTIRQHPDWEWNGTTAFIGTPVEKVRPLRDWLTYFGMGLKMKFLFPEFGSFAGAVGACRLAAAARDEVLFDGDSPGLLGRLSDESRRRIGVVGSVMRRLVKRS